jgi:hypothetical protein
LNGESFDDNPIDAFHYHQYHPATERTQHLPFGHDGSPSSLTFCAIRINTPLIDMCTTIIYIRIHERRFRCN